MTSVNIVVIAALKSLSDNSNNWLILALTSVDSFPLRIGHNVPAFPVPSSLDFLMNAMTIRLYRHCILLYSYEDCCSFCFGSPWTWLGFNCELCHSWGGQRSVSAHFVSLTKFLVCPPHAWPRGQQEAQVEFIQNLGCPPLALSFPEFSTHPLVILGSFLCQKDGGITAGVWAHTPLAVFRANPHTKRDPFHGGIFSQVSVPLQDDFCSLPRAFGELVFHTVQNFSVVVCGWEFYFKGTYSSIDFLSWFLYLVAL